VAAFIAVVATAVPPVVDFLEDLPRLALAAIATGRFSGVAAFG